MFLHTYNLKFLGPLPSTHKNYKYLFTVVDTFAKFIWIYPVQTIPTKDALDKLQLQQSVFGNPCQIITNKDTAFMSNDFKTSFEHVNIEHLQLMYPVELARLNRLMAH